MTENQERSLANKADTRNNVLPNPRSALAIARIRWQSTRISRMLLQLELANTEGRDCATRKMQRYKTAGRGSPERHASSNRPSHSSGFLCITIQSGLLSSLVMSHVKPSLRLPDPSQASITSQHPARNILTMDIPQEARQRHSSASRYILESRHISEDPLEIDGVRTLPNLFRYQVARRGDATLFRVELNPQTIWQESLTTTLSTLPHNSL
ncbi:hypothetical protein BDV96DRAFT_318849 [Lophiotrema nucula]|uniref:Uncharacterized protein n=1 Tax=Lophiotrema nucula TaxID=690887 RepID=A0A6A5ZM74_9PLEO|nr:hypothetical protein BDV96DRAFT_318849 [Lophiotrema nucula]